MSIHINDSTTDSSCFWDSVRQNRIATTLVEFTQFYTERAISFIGKRLSERVTFTQALSSPIQTAIEQPVDYEEILQKWVDQSLDIEKTDRKKTQKIVLDFFANPKAGHLDFSRLSISSLPNIWNHPSCISFLKKLDCFSSSITSLPENIGNCSALEYLNCVNSHITSLPDSIGNCKALQYLNCSSCPITSLPDSIGNCKALQHLACASCLITSLPENIEYLTALQRFTLHNCRTLRALPNAITMLPKNCRISIDGCNLSDAVMQSLRQIISAPNYQGPQFHYSMEYMHRPLEERDINASLDALYTNAKIPKSSLPQIIENLENQVYLKTWLNRLSWAAEGGQGQVEKIRFQAFYQAIVKNLELAETNAPYREIFWGQVIEGCSSCGDRIALSVIRLGMWRERMDIVKGNPQSTWRCLKQFLAIQILEDCAKNKIPTMSFFDEIEVYLAYPIQLRTRLGLSLDVTEMLFSSGLKQIDLDQAEQAVKTAWQDPEQIFAYLKEQPEWIEVLIQQNPEKMNYIETLKNQINSPDTSEEVSLALHNEIENQLKDITLKIWENICDL